MPCRESVVWRAPDPRATLSPLSAGSCDTRRHGGSQRLRLQTSMRKRPIPHPIALLTVPQRGVELHRCQFLRPGSFGADARSFPVRERVAPRLAVEYDVTGLPGHANAQLRHRLGRVDAHDGGVRRDRVADVDGRRELPVLAQEHVLIGVSASNLPVARRARASVTPHLLSPVPDMRLFILAATAVVGAGLAPNPAARSPRIALPRVVIETTSGSITVEIDSVRAPLTAANFLRYVDSGAYTGGRFHRTVTAANQPTDSVRIAVIQAGANGARTGARFPAIQLEPT